MRIAELTTYTSRLNGGVFFALTALLPRIHLQGGYDVRVFGYSDAKTGEDVSLWQGVPVEAFAPVPPRTFGYSPGFRPALEAYAPDLIHSHGLWTYLSCAALAVHRRLDKPMVVSPHGMLDGWALRRAGLKKKLIAGLFQDRQMERAAVLHALNSAEARAIRDYGIRTPVVIIPNGVKADSVRAEVPPPWSGHAVASRPHILLFVGRLHPKKGLRELVQAWRLLQARPGPARDWGLVIAGWDETGLQAELQGYLDAEGLAGSVCFCGPVLGEQKAAAFAQAHAFVHPSFSEGLPMGVLEAWAYGLPAIITPGCNLPEGLERNAALGCEPQPDSIARAIGRLAGMSDAERKAMSLSAKALVRDKFDWDKVAADMRRLYAAVAREDAIPDDLAA